MENACLRDLPLRVCQVNYGVIASAVKCLVDSSVFGEGSRPAVCFPAGDAGSGEVGVQPSHPLPSLPVGPTFRARFIKNKTGNKFACSHVVDTLEVEEHFGQLWLIPSPPRRRHPTSQPLPPQAVSPSRFLCWIQKDLIELGSFTAADCHPAVRQAFDPSPKTVKLAHEVLGPGSLSFAEVVRRGVKMSDRRGGSSSARAAGQIKAAMQKTNSGGGRKQPSAPPSKDPAPPPRPTKSTTSTATSSQVQSSQAIEVEVEQVLDRSFTFFLYV